MRANAILAEVQVVMAKFAQDTGLTGENPARRYLWTDAFAVCNYLELHRRTSEPRYLELATQLVYQVHHVLGRHRPDDARTGWISGLAEANGEEHPTAGGLRIGKPLPERSPSKPYDPQLEWERDGQYFHYLTKWMQALLRMHRVTGEAHYHRWALELAQAVSPAFVLDQGNEIRMVWKVSVDLSRPLVPSMGQHDPLDGYLTFLEIEVGAAPHSLTSEIKELAHICRQQEWRTDDPLGLGGILTDAYRATQRAHMRPLELPNLAQDLLDAAGYGLRAIVRQGSLEYPAHHRLPFRELGLAIGLRALERLQREASGSSRNPVGLQATLEPLLVYVPLADRISRFWLDHANRAAPTWRDHLDINMVMLATALAPETYLIP